MPKEVGRKERVDTFIDIHVTLDHSFLSQNQLLRVVISNTGQTLPSKVPCAQLTLPNGHQLLTQVCANACFEFLIEFSYDNSAEVLYHSIHLFGG